MAESPPRSSPRAPSTQAVVTLCTGTEPGYAKGVLTLRQSLLDLGCERDFVVLCDPAARNRFGPLLERIGCRTREVEPVAGAGVDRAGDLCPWFAGVFAKLRLWELAEYSRVAFLDSDTLVVRRFDALFDQRGLVAAPDASRTDHFNSGFFITEPCGEMAHRLTASAETYHCWDGGDQSLLNAAFPWYLQPAPPRVDFGHNCQADRVPASASGKRNVTVAHFYGARKPWEPEPGKHGGTEELPYFCRSGFEKKFRRGVLPLWQAWHRAARKGSGPAPRTAAPATRGRAPRGAFATVLIHGSQTAAALALRHSLADRSPGIPLLALLAPSVDPAAGERLERRGVSTRRVPWVLTPEQVSPATAASLVRLRLWQLGEYSKILYLAPTVLALRDVSDLLERPAPAAPPRSQRPDLCLSRVLVLEPSERRFEELREHALRHASTTFERCLHGFFGDWFRLGAAHRLAQHDGFELESLFYLAHTELLEELVARGLPRLVDFAPFIFAGRWLLAPDPRVGPDRALDFLRGAVVGGSPEQASVGSPAPLAEAWLDHEPGDSLWARERWCSTWRRCREALGVGEGL